MKYRSRIANNPVVRRTVDACKSGRFSHAYLIVCEDAYTSGVAGSLIIAAIAGGDAERVQENGYVDITVVPQNKDKVVTPDIDLITSTANITPTELEKKFYRIKKGETMNESAQNKLLKTLEEAPSGVVIVIECASVAGILPTVISRCNRIDVPPFDYDTLKEGLQEETGNDNTDFAIGLSGGYFGLAEKILSDKSYSEDFSLAMETLLCMKTSRNILTYSQLFMKRSATLPDIIDCLALILEDCMLLSSGLTQKVRLKSKIKDITELSAGYTAVAVALIMPRLSEAKRKLSLYCNAQSVVDGLLFSILEVKAKCQKL